MASPLRYRPTRYTFGAMSLGSDGSRLEADIALVREVMERGAWVHCSPTYHRGFSFMALRCAFDEAPSQRPPVIVKIRDGSERWLRFETEDVCRRLGIDGIDIAQLVAMERGPGCLMDQLRVGDGPALTALADLRHRGLIRQVALYCDRGNADAALAAATKSPLVEALIGYWNARQDCLGPAGWQALRESGLSFLALRTLGGGLADPAVRAEQEALAAACGCADPVELALRLVASEPAVATTIGGTASREHWCALHAAAASATPLPAETLARLRESQIPA